jgi:hypothetical protein
MIGMGESVTSPHAGPARSPVSIVDDAAPFVREGVVFGVGSVEDHVVRSGAPERYRLVSAADDGDCLAGSARPGAMGRNDR